MKNKKIFAGLLVAVVLVAGALFASNTNFFRGAYLGVVDAVSQPEHSLISSAQQGLSRILDYDCNEARLDYLRAASRGSEMLEFTEGEIYDFLQYAYNLDEIFEINGVDDKYLAILSLTENNSLREEFIRNCDEEFIDKEKNLNIRPNPVAFYNAVQNNVNELDVLVGPSDEAFDLEIFKTAVSQLFRGVRMLVFLSEEYEGYNFKLDWFNSYLVDHGLEDGISAMDHFIRSILNDIPFIVDEDSSNGELIDYLFSNYYKSFKQFYNELKPYFSFIVDAFDEDSSKCELKDDFIESSTIDGKVNEDVYYALLYLNGLKDFRDYCNGQN